MKVKQLIKALKKMPQNLEVEVAMHDNYEHESAGEVYSVMHFIKANYDTDEMGSDSKAVFVNMRDECVIIRC